MYQKKRSLPRLPTPKPGAGLEEQEERLEHPRQSTGTIPGWIRSLTHQAQHPSRPGHLPAPRSLRGQKYVKKWE